MKILRNKGYLRKLGNSKFFFLWLYSNEFLLFFYTFLKFSLFFLKIFHKIDFKAISRILTRWTDFAVWDRCNSFSRYKHAHIIFYIYLDCGFRFFPFSYTLKMKLVWFYKLTCNSICKWLWQKGFHRFRWD